VPLFALLPGIRLGEFGMTMPAAATAAVLPARRSICVRGALAMLSPDGTIAYAMVGTAGLFVYAVVLFSIVMLSGSRCCPGSGWVSSA
jgi:hypothetical protein